MLPYARKSGFGNNYAGDGAFSVDGKSYNMKVLDNFLEALFE
jgi:hypothetical protein